MRAVIEPGTLRGRVTAPSSKSWAHRLLIAAALADRATDVRLNAVSDDILATAGCLRQLGAGIERTQEGYRVSPVRPRDEKRTLFCRESGSTLRFLMPVAAALGGETTFTGEGRLPLRPNAVLAEALRAHGARVDGDLLPLTVSGRLQGGRYPVAGNVSSQYITGLMLALPLCAGDSEIALTTPLGSAPYIDITLGALKAFGIRVEPVANGWYIPGGQRYTGPGTVEAEGDWSAASFWLAAGCLGAEIAVDGLRQDSPQGDRCIAAQLASLGGVIDVSGTPDAVPALAAAAALHPGVTRITGAARLRLKESDRLRAVTAMLTALGGQCEEHEDGLTVTGVDRLRGGTVDGCGDHRIVMAAAVAACRAEGPVTITGAQAVDKSYPDFFRVYSGLGGRIHVEPDR